MEVEFKGGLISVGLSKRGENDNHILVSISIEDDGYWHKKLEISNCWLDELINKLQEAKSFIEKQDKDLVLYKFKN